MAANRSQEESQNAAAMQQWLGDFRAIFNQQASSQQSGGASAAAPSSAQSAQAAAYYQQLAAAASAANVGGALGAAGARPASSPGASQSASGPAGAAGAAAAPAAAPAAAGGQAAAAGGGGDSAALVQWLLMQVGFMVDNQIKRARAEAEQNFKVELGKLKRDLATLQQFTEKQGTVIASVSKDLAAARTEVARAAQTINGCKIHCSQQQQLMHTIQLALGNVVKELDDVDKRLAVVTDGGDGYAEGGYMGEYGAAGDFAAMTIGGEDNLLGAGQEAVEAMTTPKETKLDAGAQEFVPGASASVPSKDMDAGAPEFVPQGIKVSPPPGLGGDE